MLPVRNSLRELLRTAITTLSPRASVNAGDGSFDESFSIPNAACGILEHFPPKVPPTTFPRSTACTVARLTNYLSLIAMGMVSPDKNQLTNLKEVRTAYQIDGTYPVAQHRAT